MKSPKKPSRRGPSHPAAYSLRVVCELTGLPSKTLMEYRQAGLVSALSRTGGGRHQFDDDALRTLRRIEHLRTRYGMSLGGLKLTLGLLAELEALQEHLRLSR